MTSSPVMLRLSFSGSSKHLKRSAGQDVVSQIPLELRAQPLFKDKKVWNLKNYTHNTIFSNLKSKKFF